MSVIVLATLNARYSHSSFGLRYLQANLAELRDASTLLEFTINDHRTDVLAAILAQNPQIVGLGVYIWNVEPLTRLVSDLKRVRPEIVVVLGGPEVSYEAAGQPIVELADFVIAGEADTAFRDLCRLLLKNERVHEKLIMAELPAVQSLQLPYDLYSDNDIASRVIYVEVSRGCPYSCEFCLSALDIPVRLFEVPQFLEAMQGLIDRGARQFKFVDRTFNLNLKVSRTILQFFLDRYVPGLFLHFEMIPDRLPESLRELIARFPAGALQFEIGVQTFNDQTGTLISRVQNNAALEDNFRYLRSHTGVHIHADLIVGLPGEDLPSFAAGFDRLYALRPQEIQIGMLKRLRGTPIVRHESEWQLTYSSYPPYEILSTSLLSFDQIQQLRVFAGYWDLVGNSGNFLSTLQLLCGEQDSAFGQFQDFCSWLRQHQSGPHGIALTRLFRLVFDYLCGPRGLLEQTVAESLWSDYCRVGRRDRPDFLRGFALPQPQRSHEAGSLLPERQSRHLK
jgi:radical SAM superfamily enzyme YgiQ (UPF0313 family)